eukprot:5044100-Pleurochrysis_carterae.AAC.1
MTLPNPNPDRGLLALDEGGGEKNESARQVLHKGAERCMTKKGRYMTIDTLDSFDAKTWSAESELGKALFNSDLGIDALQSQLSPVSVPKVFNIDACSKKPNWPGASVKRRRILLNADATSKHIRIRRQRSVFPYSSILRIKKGDLPTSQHPLRTGRPFFHIWSFEDHRKPYFYSKLLSFRWRKRGPP